MLAIYFLNTWTFLAAIVLGLGVLGYFIYQLVREISPTTTLMKEFMTEVNQSVSSVKEILPNIQSIGQNITIQMQEIQEIKQILQTTIDNTKTILLGVSGIRANKNVSVAVRYGKAQLFKKRRTRFHLSQSILNRNLKKAKEWLLETFSYLTQGKMPGEKILTPMDRLSRLLRKETKKLGKDSKGFSWKVPAAFAGGGILGGAVVSLWDSGRALPGPDRRERKEELNHEDQDHHDFIRSSSHRIAEEKRIASRNNPAAAVPQEQKPREEQRKEVSKKITLRDIPTLLKETFNEWTKDKAPRLGAALSYYTVFSLAPTLVVVISVAGIVFGADAVQNQIINQIQSLVGKEGADAVREMLIVARQPKIGIVATLIGVITLLLGASGVFGELQDAMNTIWGVPPKETGGILGLIRQRFTSFAMVLGIGFLLLASLVLSAGLAAVGEYMGTIFGLPEGILQVLNFLFSFVVITFLFALLFKVVPDAEIAWHDVWIGAAVTALLFTLGKFLIGLYLGKSDVTTAFGAAGSLVLLLVWVYYSAQIVFFGAEFTKVYANRYGSRIHPENP